MRTPCGPVARTCRAELREQILEELRDPSGRLDAMLTRNVYGSVVLNAARVLFVDVDIRRPTLVHRIAALFGARKFKTEAEILDGIRQTLQHDSGGSHRV